MIETIYREIAIDTPDGACRVHLQAPAKGGPHPGDTAGCCATCRRTTRPTAHHWRTLMPLLDGALKFR